MRTAGAIIGSFTALAVVTAPVLAKNSKAQPTDDKSVSSPCHSLEEGPGGAWIEIPCQELGSAVRLQTKPTDRNAEQANH